MGLSEALGRILYSKEAAALAEDGVLRVMSPLLEKIRDKGKY